MTLALYRRRAFGKEECTSTVLRRAFDKAVRTKPPVFAVDAGPMQIQWWEGAVSNCAGAMRRSAQDNSVWPGAGERVKASPIAGVEKREEAICSAARRRGTERGEARNVFVLGTAVSCGDRDRWRTKLDLGSRKPFDDPHRSTALWAASQIVRVMVG